MDFQPFRLVVGWATFLESIRYIMRDYGLVIMPVGLHRDRPLWYVLEMHMGYYFWFIENSEPSDLRNVMIKFLEQRVNEENE